MTDPTNNAIEAMFREFGPVVVWGNIHTVVGWTPKDGAGIHPLAEVDDDRLPDEVAVLINDGARARGWLPPVDAVALPCSNCTTTYTADEEDPELPGLCGMCAYTVAAQKAEEDSGPNIRLPSCYRWMPLAMSGEWCVQADYTAAALDNHSKPDSLPRHIRPGEAEYLAWAVGAANGLDVGESPPFPDGEAPEWTARAALEDIAKGMDRRALAAREGKEQAERDYMGAITAPLRDMYMTAVGRLNVKRSDSEHFARLCRTHPAYGEEP